MNHSIYLDHNATTPLLAEVAAAMDAWQSTGFGNASSQHQFGRAARQALEDAREDIAHMLGAQLSGAQPDRLIFTSGGTEANNLFLLGQTTVDRPRQQPGEAIISAIEHPSVVGPADSLARQGWKIHRLGVDRRGIVEEGQLDERMNDQTRFVSVMLVNNETGVIQPLAELAQRCAARRIALHTDAAQAVGKLPVSIRALGVAALSVAAHKFHGPLGIGALLLRGDASLEPILLGGFQQQSLRPGTEPVALAVGFQAALAAAHREADVRSRHLRQLRDRLEAGLRGALASTIQIHGEDAPRAPHTSNVAFLGLDRQALVMALDLAGVACSTGSACASGSSEPSRVLSAMGASPAALHGSVRFSLGATTTDDEIDEAIDRIVRVVGHMTPSPGNMPAGRSAS